MSGAKKSRNRKRYLAAIAAERSSGVSGAPIVEEAAPNATNVCVVLAGLPMSSVAGVLAANKLSCGALASLFNNSLLLNEEDPRGNSDLGYDLSLLSNELVPLRVDPMLSNRPGRRPADNALANFWKEADALPKTLFVGTDIMLHDLVQHLTSEVGPIGGFDAVVLVRPVGSSLPEMVCIRAVYLLEPTVPVFSMTVGHTRVRLETLMHSTTLTFGTVVRSCSPRPLFTTAPVDPKDAGVALASMVGHFALPDIQRALSMLQRAFPQYKLQGALGWAYNTVSSPELARPRQESKWSDDEKGESPDAPGGDDDEYGGAMARYANAMYQRIYDSMATLPVANENSSSEERLQALDECAKGFHSSGVTNVCSYADYLNVDDQDQHGLKHYARKVRVKATHKTTKEINVSPESLQPLLPPNMVFALQLFPSGHTPLQLTDGAVLRAASAIERDAAGKIKLCPLNLVANGGLLVPVLANLATEKGLLSFNPDQTAHGTDGYYMRNVVSLLMHQIAPNEKNDAKRAQATILHILQLWEQLDEDKRTTVPTVGVHMLLSMIRTLGQAVTEIPLHPCLSHLYMGKPLKFPKRETWTLVARMLQSGLMRPATFGPQMALLLNKLIADQFGASYKLRRTNRQQHNERAAQLRLKANQNVPMVEAIPSIAERCRALHITPGEGHLLNLPEADSRFAAQTLFPSSLSWMHDSAPKDDGTLRSKRQIDNYRTRGFKPLGRIGNDTMYPIMGESRAHGHPWRLMPNVVNSLIGHNSLGAAHFPNAHLDRANSTIHLNDMGPARDLLFTLILDPSAVAELEEEKAEKKVDPALVNLPEPSKREHPELSTLMEAPSFSRGAALDELLDVPGFSSMLQHAGMPAKTVDSVLRLILMVRQVEAAEPDRDLLLTPVLQDLGLAHLDEEHELKLDLVPCSAQLELCQRFVPSSEITALEDGCQICRACLASHIVDLCSGEYVLCLAEADHGPQVVNIASCPCCAGQRQLTGTTLTSALRMAGVHDSLVTMVTQGHDTIAVKCSEFNRGCKTPECWWEGNNDISQVHCPGCAVLRNQRLLREHLEAESAVADAAAAHGPVQQPHAQPEPKLRGVLREMISVLF